MSLLFKNAVPTSYLWVSATASATGDGTKEKPFRTIQLAVDKATAGTAIMVRAGTYVENVKLPTKNDGNDAAPIWLLSADGPQKAHIVAATNTVSTVYGYGTDNIVLSGFSITGGKNGIQFSQSGSDFSNLTRNIVIENNVIKGSVDDGIKVSQGRNVQVVGNVTTYTGQEGIDFVAVNNALVQGNDVSGARGAAGIFAKGGSTKVVIDGNHVHDIPIADGILVGGWTEDKFFVPGYDTYEAKNITVTNNLVTHVARRPLNILGGIDSLVTKNYLEANVSYYTGVGVASGNPTSSHLAQSYNNRIFNNIIANKNKISIAAGSHDISFYGNASSGTWSTLTGLDAYRALYGVSIAVDISHSASSLPVKVPVPVTLEASVSTTLNSLVANLTLTGTAGINATGNSLDNALAGNIGNNILDGKGGADVMSGDLGNDTYIVDSLGDIIKENSNAGIDAVMSALSSITLTTNVENFVYTGTGNVHAIGNSGANTLIGGTGNDLLDGRDGADKLIGGRGADVYVVNNLGDLVVERVGEGADTVRSSINITLGNNVEKLILFNNIAAKGIGNNLNNAITGNAIDNILDGGAGVDILTGGSGNDTFVFSLGQSDGDTIADFTGSGALSGDQLAFYGFGHGTITNVTGTSDYIITPDDVHGGAAAAERIHIHDVTNLDTHVGGGNNDVFFY